jgi:hypothetical protein
VSTEALGSSDPSTTPRLTASQFGYVSRPELSKWTGKSPRFWHRLARAGSGPPITFIGKTPYYRLSGVRAWLKSQEQPANPRMKKSRGHRS